MIPGGSSLSEVAISAQPGIATVGGVGAMAPFVGFGTQGDANYRGELFWADETPRVFYARESDGEQMLGITDKDPYESVWYECEFRDILNGASISSYSINTVDVYAVASEKVGTRVRVLTAGILAGELATVEFRIVCSDTSKRKRTLKIRGRYL